MSIDHQLGSLNIPNGKNTIHELTTKKKFCTICYNSQMLLQQLRHERMLICAVLNINLAVGPFSHMHTRKLSEALVGNE